MARALASFSVPNTVVPRVRRRRLARLATLRAPRPDAREVPTIRPSALDGDGHTHSHSHSHSSSTSSPRADHPAASESAHAHSHSHGDHAHAHSHSHGDHAHSLSHVVEDDVTPAWPPVPRDGDGDSPTYAPRNPPLERGAGHGKTLFVDAYVAGVAGDMFVAALLDLGVPVSALETQLAALDDLVGYRLDVLGTERSCVAAPRFVVSEVGPESQPLRDYAQIRAMLETSRLDPGVRDKALRAFALLARGEASVHGVPEEDVHFHEVGAVDSIVDIVAVAAGLDYLQCEEVVVSPLPMGRGVLRGAAHGPLPCPPPATVSCLCDAGVPTHDPGADGEFVTPTGACLVAALKTSAERWPDMFLPERCAYGAGTKRWRDRPNLLRLVLGTRAGKRCSS